MVSILMATTCPTTEAGLQAGLLPAQERRKGCFAKASGRLKSFRRPEGLAIGQSDVRALFCEQASDSRILPTGSVL